MILTREELESKLKENKITNSYLLDKPEACDTSVAAEILRDILSSK